MESPFFIHAGYPTIQTLSWQPSFGIRSFGVQVVFPLKPHSGPFLQKRLLSQEAHTQGYNVKGIPWHQWLLVFKSGAMTGVEWGQERELSDRCQAERSQMKAIADKALHSGLRVPVKGQCWCRVSAAGWSVNLAHLHTWTKGIWSDWETGKMHVRRLWTSAAWTFLFYVYVSIT